jgi:hypothetical protein
MLTKEIRMILFLLKEMMKGGGYGFKCHLSNLLDHIDHDVLARPLYNSTFSAEEGHDAGDPYFPELSIRLF